VFNDDEFSHQQGLDLEQDLFPNEEMPESASHVEQLLSFLLLNPPSLDLLGSYFTSVPFSGYGSDCGSPLASNAVDGKWMRVAV
jgi:hypothetical protein